MSLNGIEVLTLNQLKAQDLPELYYLADPILPVGGFLLLTGDEKTFKSYLAMTIGYQMAVGEKVLGRFPVPKALSVLYVEMEVGKYELKTRREPIINRNPSVGGENFWVVSKDMRIQLDKEQGFLLLKNTIEKVDPRILILDPIVEFHSSNENSAIDMKKMMSPIRKLVQDRGMGMIVCHHNTKYDPMKPSSPRGAYLTGAANTIVKITRPKADRNARIQLDFVMRSDAPPYPMTFDFTEGGFVRYE